MNNGVFPLYEQLYKSTVDKALTSRQMTTFKNKIKDMDDIGYEYIFTLIRCHYLKHLEAQKTSDDTDILYNCKDNGTHLIFDLDILPTKLIMILYKFILMHSKTMKSKTMKSKTMKSKCGVVY